MKAAGVALALLLLGVSVGATAHPGGLDRHGCHTNRRTGDYHCHRARASEAPRSGLQQLSPARTDGTHGRARGQAFRNCTEAREAGAAPVRRGDPGDGPHLDRDNDGVGCEPSRGR
jgi:hypothetical protein